MIITKPLEIFSPLLSLLIMSPVARYFLTLFLVHTTPSMACGQLFQQSFRYARSDASLRLRTSLRPTSLNITWWFSSTKHVRSRSQSMKYSVEFLGTTARRTTLCCRRCKSFKNHDEPFAIVLPQERTSSERRAIVDMTWSVYSFLLGRLRPEGTCPAWAILPAGEGQWAQVVQDGAEAGGGGGGLRRASTALP